MLFVFLETTSTTTTSTPTLEPTSSSDFTRPPFPGGTILVSLNTRCGVSNNGAVCSVDTCCGHPLNTPDYYCGTGANYCGKDRCNQEFGSCWNNATTSGTPSSPVSLPITRITRRGAKLYQGSSVFRFLSANVPAFLLNEDRGGDWIPPTTYEQNDAMVSISTLEGRVVRTYTLAAGPMYHVTGIQTYSETAFQALDQAVAAAGRNGIRMIIPLINNWWPDKETAYWNYGNYAAFAALYNATANQFFTSPAVRTGFKHLIMTLLTRKNTVTGWTYADDPTLLAISTGNELRGREQDPPPAEWTLDIAQYIKSLAPNLLVMDGTFFGWKRWRTDVLKSPYVDLFTGHYYGENPQLINDDANAATQNGKAFIVGEFGLTTSSYYTSYMNNIVSNTNVTGGLIWSLRYHARDGGFYTHYEGKDAYYSYHVPSFPENITAQFGAEEATLIPQLRSKALQITGQSTSKGYPVPPVPQVIQGDATITPRNLRWRGSAYAASYNIYRGTKGTNGFISWGSSPIATGVKDNVQFGKKIYSDTSAVRGQQYFYSIRAVSLSGGVSTYSEIIGPIVEP
ncbi:hypothetical protein HDV00_012641 [Rhizophlyctis rosea]|nr:hypothetical protein HDV00_012641 [Rhizophlyctis rosea]